MGRLLAILGLIVVAGCGDGDARPAAGPAGKVVAVAGEVRAERGDPPESRVLAVGDPVHAEDVVITADEASVQIMLDHNQAIWSLEGGERRPVRQSAAWTAPKQQGGSLLAGADDDRTTAAGRHAEREAAETRAAVDRSGTEGDEAPAAASDEGSAIADEDPPAAAAEPAAPPPPPPPPPVKRKRSRDPGPGDSTPKGGAKVSGGEVESLDSVGTVGRGGGSGTGSGYGTGSGQNERKVAGQVKLAELQVDGGLAPEVVRRVIRQRLSQIRFCYEQELRATPDLTGALQFRFAIAADGKVTTSAITGGDASLTERTGECVRRVWTRMRFPASEGDAVSIVTLGLTFQPGD
jgi:hypothetical protein